MAKKQNAALGNFVENSENAKQQNNVKKEKKKLFSFSKPENRDEEDEDELM